MSLASVLLVPWPALHWRAGWTLILLGLASGAALGIFFDREDFLGGYASLRRRLVRLGHVALVALGMLNVLVASFPAPGLDGGLALASSAALLSGAALMPLACFLAAWRPALKPLFALPVLLLATSVALLLGGGP